MKLTSKMLQSLIREEKDRLQEIVVNQDVQDTKDPIDGEEKKVNLTALATRLARNVYNDASLIAQVAAKAKQIALGQPQIMNATEEESNMTGFPNRKDVDEASTEKQRVWACANKDEQPELAHICADTALSGKKKKKKKK
jgi:hypothetical protein